MVEVEIDSEPQMDEEVMMETKKMVNGILLEAAFIDPAYAYPPPDGQGKNAVELQIPDDESAATAPSEAGESCQDDHYYHDHHLQRMVQFQVLPFGRRGGHVRQHVLPRVQRRKRAWTKKRNKKYRSVPEGILIYRLDTSDRSIRLVSDPSPNTDMDTLMTNMVVADAKSSDDKTRRGIQLRGVDGTEASLVACEQRTAIAWLEAMDMMLGHAGRGDKVRKHVQTNVLVCACHH